MTRLKWSERRFDFIALAAAAGRRSFAGHLKTCGDQ
jgi:hypothetical protein